METLKNVAAWWRGFRECASDMTTHYDWPRIESYDSGRAFGCWLFGYE